MIYITPHKIWAIVIFLGVIAYEWLTEGNGSALITAEILGIFITPILFCELFAILGRFGLMEMFAKDRQQGLMPGVVATFFWLLFLIASLMMLFNWWVY